MGQQRPKPGRQNVTGAAREAFNRMLDEREAEGIATYGTTLQTHNGRDAHKDLAEELIDAWQYATQAEMERADLLARAEAAERQADDNLQRAIQAEMTRESVAFDRDHLLTRVMAAEARVARLEAAITRLTDEYEPDETPPEMTEEEQAESARHLAEALAAIRAKSPAFALPGTPYSADDVAKLRRYDANSYDTGRWLATLDALTATPTPPPDRREDEATVIERLAALSHEQWAGWARWMFEKWDQNHASGEPFQDRWKRQIATPYDQLSEAEQESDRREARKMLAAIAGRRADSTGGA